MAISLRLSALASSTLQLQSSAFTSQLFLHAAGADTSAVCCLAAVAEVLRAGPGATKYPKAVCSFLFVSLFFSSGHLTVLRAPWAFLCLNQT